MKRIIALCGVLLALASTAASAAPGVNLRWNACLGDGGVINRNFACNTNVGTNMLTGSIQLYAPVLQATGHEVALELAAASAQLPAWWQFRTAGTCRQNSLAMNVTIGANENCVDWASAQATGAIAAYTVGPKGPNTARILAAIAVPTEASADLSVGTEYFVFNLTINNAKTVGAGACAGCETPVCLIYFSNRVTTPVSGNYQTIAGSTIGADSFYATWQGGGVPVTYLGSGCPGATPTRNATWGAVKSMYR